MATRKHLTSAALSATAIFASVVGVATPAHAVSEICGTFQGTDGQNVNAMIGLEWRNTSTGAKSGGYTSTKTFNPTLSSGGSTAGSSSFCLPIDTRATEYRIEAYPKNPSGTTDYTYYSGAAHDWTSTDVAPKLRFARAYGVGASTGGIRATAYENGNPVTVTRILATGENENPQGARGFGVIDQSGSGTLTKNSLPGESRYSVIVTFYTAARVKKAVTMTGIGVRTGQVTDIVAYTGTKPAAVANRWSSQAASQRGTFTPLPGDFTGDGKTDVLWYAPGTTADSFWAATSGGSFASPAARTISGSYQPAVGDFDGNGVDDVFWYAPGAAADYIWNYSAGGGYTSRPLPSGGYATNRAYVGDFDRNGVDDLLFSDPSGPDAVRLMRKDGTYKQFNLSLPAGNLRVGDLNADLRDDFQIWTTGASTQTVNLYLSNGAGAFAHSTDSTGKGYQPIVGDYNGDFRADVVQYQAGTASDYLWRGWMFQGANFAKEGTQLGIDGTFTRPFVGDFDGNGLDDIFWYQPGTGADALWMNSQAGWNNKAIS